MDSAIVEPTAPVLQREMEGTSRGFASRESGAWHCPLWLFVAGSAAMLWVALYNRYPVVNPDSANYLLTSITHRAVPPYRSPIYSVFIQLTNFHTTPWLVIFGQSMFVMFVLYLLFDWLAPQGLDARARTSWFAALIALLSLATSLPWLAGEIMPDVFTGFIVLALFPLLFDTKLAPWRRATLSCVLALCVGVHLSHIPILLPVLAIMLAAVFWRARSLAEPGMWKRIGAYVLIPVLVAVAGIASLNWRAGLSFTLAPGGNAFVLGRMFASGMAGDYLRDHCPAESYVACGHLQDLPKTEWDFLFGGPLLGEMGGLRSPEITRIVHGTMLAYPGRFAWECLRQTGRQLITLGSDDPVILKAGPAWLWITQVILAQYPGDRTAFFDSGQNRGKLIRLADWISPFHVAVFWLSLGLSLLLYFGTRQPESIRKLFWFSVLMLVANAAGTAALSGVFPRYQSRVEWLMPFCCFLAVMHWWTDRHLRSRGGDYVPRASAGHQA